MTTMRTRCLWGILATLAVLLGAGSSVAADAASAAPEYAYLPSPGPHGVIELGELALRDATRKKLLPLKAYIPEGEGTFPVILFSHGAGESNESASHLCRHWSSYGYVCLSPGHAQQAIDASTFSVSRFVREFSLIKDLGDAQAFDNRVDDLKLVLDRLGELERAAPALAGKMDANRVGVAGHSLGAVTAMLIGGATLTPERDGVTWSFGDDRVKAIVVMSGAGLDPEAGFVQTSWNGVRIPMLVVAGSKDPGRGGKLWRTDPYEYAPAGGKYLLYIVGANHMSYIGVGQPETFAKSEVGAPRLLPGYKKMLRKRFPSLAQEGIFQYVMMGSTAFWDASLKGAARGAEFLEGGALGRYSFGQAEVKHK